MIKNFLSKTYETYKIIDEEKFDAKWINDHQDMVVNEFQKIKLNKRPAFPVHLKN